MLPTAITIVILISLESVSAEENAGLGVYGEVPGLDPSPYYKIELRKENSNSWLTPFTFLTECTGDKFCNTTGVFRHLANWSNSYINFEMEQAVNVELKITKLFGDPTTKAVVHPMKV